MFGGTLIDAFSLLLLIIFAAGFSVATIIVSVLIGRKEISQEGLSPYECGLDPTGTPRSRFSVKFFMTAMLFIIFEVEIIFLYPWAVTYKSAVESGMGPFIFAETAFFVGILFIGFVYLWKSGALNWEK